MSDIESTTIVVSALIDIGRSEWNNQWRRDFDEYLDAFCNVCQLENYMVIFVTEDLVDTIKKFRQGKEDQTYIEVVTLDDYVLYKYRNKFDEILEYNKTRKWCHVNAPNCVEYTIPLYNVVVNNKVEFVYRAKKLQPFKKCDINPLYYVWIDAGYTNKATDFSNKKITIDKCVPNPVYITRLWQWNFEHDWVKFQEEHWPLDVVSGGFVVYKHDVIDTFRDKYYELIDEAIDKKILDDDQFYMTMLYVRHPEFFSMRDGSWFDAVNIFVE